MTLQEIEEIRKRHARKQQGIYCKFCYDDYPCDAIKLLRVLEGNG